MTDDNLTSYIRNLWVQERQAFELRTTGASTGWGSKCMPKWDGGVDSRGICQPCVWEDVADFCLANDLQPEILVAALFYGAVNMPQPNQAHGQYALKKYKFYNEPTTRQEIRISIANSLESQQSYTASNIWRLCHYGDKTEDEALRIVALDPMAPLTQLFRYCVLKNRNRPVADDYAAVALREYRRHPNLYDEVWGDWIPQELREGVTNERSAT